MNSVITKASVMVERVSFVFASTDKPRRIILGKFFCPVSLGLVLFISISQPASTVHDIFPLVYKHTKNLASSVYLVCIG